MQKKDFLPYLNWAAVGGAISSCPGKKEGGNYEMKRGYKSHKGFSGLYSMKRKRQRRCETFFKWQSLSVRTVGTQWEQGEETR